jgi:hypothetical protein
MMVRSKEATISWDYCLGRESMFLPIESLDIKDNGKTIIHMEMVYNIIKMELNIKEVSIMVSNSAKKEDMHGQMEKYMKGHLDKDL